MFKVNYRNIRTRCEICLKLTIKKPERRSWHRSGVLIVNFEQISHLFLVFLLLTLSRSMPAGLLFPQKQENYNGTQKTEILTLKYKRFYSEK